MRTRTPRIGELALPVVFVLVCSVIAVATWRAFGGSVPLEPRGYRVELRVPEADAIFANTDVRAAGVSIGKVDVVERAGRGARLVLVLEPEFAPLRGGARVIVRSKSLLGEAYVEIAPGPPDARAIPDGGQLPVANVRRAQKLDDVLQTFAPSVRRQYRRLVSGFATAVDGRGAAINDALGRAEPFANGVGAMVDELVRQQEPLTRAISDGAEVLGALGRRSASVQEAVTSSQRVLTQLASRPQDLQATIAALPTFLDRLRRGTDELGAAAPELLRATRSLRPTVPLLRPALRSLVDDTPVYRTAFGRLPSLIDAGADAAPEVTKLLQAAGPALAPIYLGARQVIPTVSLTGALRDEIVGALSNVSSMANGQMEYKGGLVRSYATAGLTAWNEIVGGWTKKLPTNRPNPYPAPGSALDIARGGLKAYDCRHIGNALILPPLGTGVPPCVTQKPWTFDGRTAHYPRLLLAKP